MLHAPCVNKPPPGCSGCCPHTILAHPVGVLVGKGGGLGGWRKWESPTAYLPTQGAQASIKTR